MRPTTLPAGSTPTSTVCRAVPAALSSDVLTHATCVTPTLSATVPPSVSGLIFVVKVGPEVGVVMLTVGAVVSMLQVKLAGVRSVFPAGSVARTWKVWLPAASAL